MGHSDSRSADRSDGLAGTVLVTVDSLRADAVSPRTAPAIADLAAGGAAFERTFAHGNWTPLSFPSVLGGRHAFADSRRPVLAGEPTLAETLSAAGVSTAGFNDANGFLTGHWGYDRGFEEFEPFTSADGSFYSRYLAAHPTVQGWLRLAGAPVRRGLGRLLGDDAPARPGVEKRAVEFLAGVEEPFFLWIHYMDAHTPYVPPPKHVRAVTDDPVGALRMLRAHAHTGLGLEVSDATLDRLRTLYRAAVHQVDASVRRVLDALDEAGLRDDAMVVVAGDHGEEFQEHGHLAHYPKLYRELVHVPLVVDHPDGPAWTVEEPVGLDAVPPTVCEAMGVEPPGSLPGESLLGTVRDGVPPDRGPVVSVAVRGETVTHQPIPRTLDDGGLLVSARSRSHTYVCHVDSGREELYDRRTDPGEQDDLLAAPGGVTVPAGLRDAVRDRLAALGGEAGADGRQDATPEAIEGRLAALGYR